MSQTRMTRQRAVILETLRDVTTHPTADEIYSMVRKKMPRISLGTVYRNLDMLAGSGEIRLLDKAGAQKHFDGNTMPHHHVRCRLCGKIGDVFFPAPVPDMEAASPIPGFVVEAVELEFVGVCDACHE